MKFRGFEVITEYKDKNIELPERQTKGSAGYDLASAIDFVIEPNKVAIIPTGLKVYMLEDEVVYIYPRSSVATKRGLVMPNSAGIIDSDYYNNPKNEGHIHIALYNISGETINIKKGERLAQAIFSKYLLKDNDDVETTRTGGFGSTN